MAITIHTGIPAKFTAGDTVIFTDSYTDFPPSAWVLTLWLSLNGGTPVSVVAAESGDTYTFTIPKATTAALAPGRYRYALVATNATETETAADGTVDVLPNYAVAQTASTAAAMLVALEAAILTLSAGTNASASFNGQSFTKKDIGQLLEARAALRAEIRAEAAAIDQLRNCHDSSRVVTRFVK